MKKATGTAEGFFRRQPSSSCSPNRLQTQLPPIEISFSIAAADEPFSWHLPSEQPKSKHPERYCSDKAGGSQDS